MAETGSRAQIGICGFLMAQITEKSKNVEYRQGIAVSWVGNKRPMFPTSGYAGEIQALFYGRDVARASECHVAEFIFGNMGIEIPTYVRNDNSDASYHADCVNTETNEKRLNCV